MLLPAACTGESGNAPQKRGPSPFPVELETVQPQALEYTIQAVGSVEAFETVLVTARVQGAVEAVLFEEGKQVEQGQVLARIETQRYALEVASAKAAWDRAVSEMNDAAAGLARREKAAAQTPGVVTPEELETWRTRAATAAARASEAEVAHKRALLNERDSSPIAPFAGIVETRTVTTGQYVQPGTVIATMLRRDPLLLRFQVSEQEASGLAAGQEVTFLCGPASPARKAVLTHVAASATGAARQVAVTAHIKAEDAPALRPGAFAEVTIRLGGSASAVSIPQTAVRPSAEGFLAFVVKDGKAVKRVLTLGLRTPDGRVEVRQGIAAGEDVVVRGAEALRHGAPVQAAKGHFSDKPGNAP